MQKVWMGTLIFAATWVCLSAAERPGERDAGVLIQTPALDTSAVQSTPFPWVAARHTVNELNLVVSNRGVIGQPSLVWSELYDFFTGEFIPLLSGFEYPRAKGTDLANYATLWVGALRRGRIGVSSGRGEWDDSPRDGDLTPIRPPGGLIRMSMVPSDPDYSEEAVSEEDILAEYSDSIGVSKLTAGEQYPIENSEALGVKISQRTMGWSQKYAEDFVLAEFRVKNYSRDVLRSLYVGVAVTEKVGMWSGDEQHGYLRSLPSSIGCGLEDTVEMYWSIDNDGDPYEGSFHEEPVWDPELQIWRYSTRHGLGLVPLDRREDELRFNWWGWKRYGPGIYDFYYYEPGWIENGSLHGISWQGGVDKKMQYRLLSNGERDFDSPKTLAIASGPPGDFTQPPIEVAALVSKGLDGFFLVSFGPLTLQPGAEVPLSFALVGGENIHTNPNNGSHLPHDPSSYYDGLDFSDLAQNAKVARWIYDNPGIDTDNDGYFGEFRVCVRDSVLVGDQWVAQKADTQWYKGDGIPDFRGALPPPAPFVWVTPVHNGLHVRFNGQVSETEKDIFLQKPDFEGYRVYIGRDERVASLSVAASYDIEDYDKYRYNLSLEEPDWQLTDEPFSKDELRCLYGLTVDPCNDTAFDPLRYTQMSPYRHPLYPNDSLFWFKPHDYNASTYGISTPITKTYPDMPDPRLLPADSITEDMYTADGYLKFYEYECTIENILPTVSYWINVTAFDYGSPAMGVAPMESDKSKGIIEAFPLHALDQPLSGSDNIYVFPNPYRIDINYRELGLEGRNQDDRWDERVRTVWFANLPPICTIHIYTIDGDRVRTIEHNTVASDPTSRRHAWDLINRNYQKVESGLYYWVVEIPGDKTQIGKLALIR